MLLIRSAVLFWGCTASSGLPATTGPSSIAGPSSTTELSLTTESSSTTEPPLTTRPSWATRPARRYQVDAKGNVIIPKSRDVGVAKPDRSKSYNPYPGFEPYWPKGEWVFDPIPTREEREGNIMCGSQCYSLYSRYGTVCARNNMFEYQTFPNYCAMKNVDCSGRSGWALVHRGACVPPLKTARTYNTHFSNYINVKATQSIDDMLKIYQSRYGIPDYEVLFRKSDS